MNGELINNVRYADDTAIIASSLEDLQSLLQRVSDVSEDLSKSKAPIRRVSLNQTPIEHVEKFGNHCSQSMGNGDGNQIQS